MTVSWRPDAHCDGPWVCKFPPAVANRTGTLWTCPGCLTEYRLSGPRRERWWRNWFAPNGCWVLVHPLLWWRR